MGYMGEDVLGFSPLFHSVGMFVCLYVAIYVHVGVHISVSVSLRVFV